MRPIELEPGSWTIDAAEHRFGEHLGRHALYLNGGIALASGVELLDGALEFDLALTPERGFPGGIWRVAGGGDYESFFVRPHQSGNPDATQYTPVFNDVSGWQLYHGERYTVPLEYRFGEWFRVRIAFAGPVAEIYVDEATRPCSASRSRSGARRGRCRPPRRRPRRRVVLRRRRLATGRRR